MFLTHTVSQVYTNNQKELLGWVLSLYFKTYFLHAKFCSQLNGALIKATFKYFRG